MKEDVRQEDVRTRPYRMTARAEASAATRQRILEAAQRLFRELPYDQVSLQTVAERAGVTVQTVLRRFASKEQLFITAADWTSRQIRSERDAAPVGDAAGVVRNVVDNYERWGDHFLNLLAQEQRTAAIRAVTDTGRRYHRGWVERSFAPLLVQVPPDDREQRLAQLVAVTDLYIWKVLRRDLGLPRDEAEAAVRDLVRRIVEQG